MAKIDQFFGKKAVATNKAKRKSSALGGETASSASEPGTASPAVAVAVTPNKRIKTESSSSASSQRQNAGTGSEAVSSSNGSISAEDVLKTIPDADASFLNVSEETKKMNFFQLKAKQNNEKPTDAIDIDSVIPKGRENCLNGLTIVFTGSLPRLDRDECVQLASRYGARITASISGKTSLVVIGSNAGPSKIEKIKKLRVKCIDENGFIELISKMPADGGDGELAKKELEKKKELEVKVQHEIELDIKKEKEAEELAERRRKRNLQNAINGSESGSAFHYEKKPVDKSTQLWTDKYAPTELTHICGNKSNVEMLNNWLTNWFQTKHSLQPGSINNFNAVLISGPPGIGKTTAATLVAKKLGYDVIEKNASDFRSKKILNDNLKVCLDNTSISGFFNDDEDKSINKKKFVLLMDEVDGMSSGDNGGVAQIAQFCRITKTPMILICNDKSLPKMRTLDKCCFDLVWRRPSAREMKSRLMTIAHREGLKLDPNLIDKLCSITHNDIRQIINIMSTVARTQKSLNFDNLNNMQDSWEKEVSLKPFDVIGKFLSGYKGSINDKISLYFNDMDIIPLMVHENYRLTRPSSINFNNKIEHLRKLQKASDLISESDIVNSKIRSGDQLWSLLPFHAILSTVYPSQQIEGQITNRINFTSWLGQNSKRMKFDRIVQNLQYHTCTKTKCNNLDLRLNYLPFIKDRLVDKLASEGAGGIDEILKFMDEYYLTKEDFDNILELSVNGSMKVDDKFKKIPTSVKSAFTRKYNSYVHPTVIYKTGDSVGGKRGKGNGTIVTGEFGPEESDNIAGSAADGDDDEDEDKEGDDEDIKKDGLIKEVKPKAKTKAKPRAKAKR